MLCKKRLWYIRHDVRSLLCEILLPCLIILCGVLISGGGGVNQPDEEYVPQVGEMLYSSERE